MPHQKTNTPLSASSASPSTAPIEFEAEFVTNLKKIFEESIVFNQVLGLKITTLQPESVHGRIEMRHELIGHYSYKRVHGGVISAALDAMGGLAVMAAIGARHMDEPVAARLHRFGKLGTIDLRIDYLRPAIGGLFHHESRGVAPRLARGVHTHGISRARRQIACRWLGGLHCVVII